MTSGSFVCGVAEKVKLSLEKVSIGLVKSNGGGPLASTNKIGVSCIFISPQL